MVEIDISKLVDHDWFTNEAFKSIRANIQFCGADIKVIMLTSCSEDEGKSTVALNLAYSFSQEGSRVLFIDGDLRKSILIGRLGIQKKVNGLAHYLTRQANFLDCICASGNLHIMPAGAIPPNPAELLSSQLFSDFIEKARSVYDIIIIDTPPLGALIDAAVITPLCDGCVFVLQANKINYKFAQSTVNQLRKAGGRILGVVLNKMDLGKRNHYYYYKRYGYRAGKYFQKQYKHSHPPYLYYGDYYGAGSGAADSAVEKSRTDLTKAKN